MKLFEVTLEYRVMIVAEEEDDVDYIAMYEVDTTFEEPDICIKEITRVEDLPSFAEESAYVPYGDVNVEGLNCVQLFRKTSI